MIFKYWCLLLLQMHHSIVWGVETIDSPWPWFFFLFTPFLARDAHLRHQSIGGKKSVKHENHETTHGNK